MTGALFIFHLTQTETLLLPNVGLAFNLHFQIHVPIRPIPSSQ